MRKSLIIVIVSFVIVVLFVNRFANAPIFDNPKEKLDFVIKEKQNARLDIIYLELLTEDSLNIDYNYGFITNFFSNGTLNRLMEENEFTTIYQSYTKNIDKSVADIGFYCLGLVSSMKQNYKDALMQFNQVSNTHLKYLNNSVGRVYD